LHRILKYSRDGGTKVWLALQGCAYKERGEKKNNERLTGGGGGVGVGAEGIEVYDPPSSDGLLFSKRGIGWKRKKGERKGGEKVVPPH